MKDKSLKIVLLLAGVGIVAYSIHIFNVSNNQQQ